MVRRSTRGWKRHQGFGLRREWLQLYLEKGSSLETAGVLGNRQVESLRAWLRTAGLEDRAGRKTQLGLRFAQAGLADPVLWELLWTNVVFNWPTAAWYVRELGLGTWTTSELGQALQRHVTLAPRTVGNAIQELVGLLERTPVGTELGQGVVGISRPRRVERRGYPWPSTEAVVHALRRLAQTQNGGLVRFSERLLWPWVIFGCGRDQVLELIGGGGEEAEGFFLTREGLVLERPVEG